MESNQASFNRNEKQLNFNTVKGTVYEIKKEEVYSSVIIEAGHERKRYVCFSLSTDRLCEVEKNISVGMKVSVRFYVASKRKENKWFTNANIITIEPFKE